MNSLGPRGQVECVNDAVALYGVEKRLLEERVVVPVVQCPGTGEEVDVLAAVLTDQERPSSSVESGGKQSDVAADFRLPLFKDFETHDLLSAGLIGN
jgi:hypothetical protein